jgi:hypothetical protein
MFFHFLFLTLLFLFGALARARTSIRVLFQRKMLYPDTGVLIETGLQKEYVGQDIMRSTSSQRMTSQNRNVFIYCIKVLRKWQAILNSLLSDTNNPALARGSFSYSD